MKQRLKNQNGTTLVELIVCMVLLSLFTLAAVTLIQPSAQAYMDIQQQTRAQNLADALIETIRGEVLEANGYIRFTDGATDLNNLDSVFASKGNDIQNNALNTVSLMTSMFKGQYTMDYSGIIAASLMIMLPELVFYVILQKYIISGMTAGAVKG